MSAVKLVIIEGIPNVGKTTMARFAAERPKSKKAWLNQAGQDWEWTRIQTEAFLDKNV